MNRCSKSMAAGLISLSICCFAVRAAVAGAAVRQTDPAASRILIASGVRARTDPAVSAAEVGRLQLGAIVSELARSPNKDKIGELEDNWIRVALPDGKEGWIFAAFTRPFDPARRSEIYRRIAAERLKNKSAGFDDSADLARFLATAITQVNDRETLADLEFGRLLALQRAAAAIPIEKAEQPPFSTWTKGREGEVSYNEIGGNWLLDSKLFWNLQKKYSTLPVGEKIAWEGARNFLGGECEGDITCFLGSLNLTDGRYLSLYPRGAHAEEAVSNLVRDLQETSELLKSSAGHDADDRSTGLKELAILRATVTKTASARKAALFKLLDQYVQYYH